MAELRKFTTPRENDLDLRRIANGSGLSAAVLPNGTVFALEHADGDKRIQINQVLGSPLQGGIGRILLRLGGARPRNVELVGPTADGEVGVGDDRIVWAGATDGVRYRVTLWLAPSDTVWLWRVAVTAERPLPCDVFLVQDIGLGERGFLMNNEAFGSQYTDHHVEQDRALGPVLMSRQNLSMFGSRHPWAIHGCLDGAKSFATDALQLFGPEFRDAAEIALPFGEDLPGTRLQHEVGCAILQSKPAELKPGVEHAWTFFGVYEPDHPAASGPEDLAWLDAVRHAAKAFAAKDIPLTPAIRSFVQDAAPVDALPLTGASLKEAFPDRTHEERRDRRLLSFFVPDGKQNRHVVLKTKEHIVARRHGTLLRSGSSLLPADDLLCSTAWMHGVFGAQLTIGNTSFHKLLSVSRDPYGITRASGLRILVELDGAWRLLTVPSAFDIGLSDCRWIYRLRDRVITVQAVASGEDAAIQWFVDVDGPPCRFLVFGHLVLGERELDHASPVEIDAEGKRASFRPDPKWLWGERYPQAVYHLVTATPKAVDAIGGDELLYADGVARDSGYVALRSRPTKKLAFAVVGSMTDAAEAERLAKAYAAGVTAAAMLRPAKKFWSEVTRDLKLRGTGKGAADLAAIETTFPWLAHNAMMHLTVPHGLEQYTGAAWGTRDVCQGPVEYLLSVEHDAPVREILRTVFAQQYADRGDWPQWFMLEPYSFIQDRHAHGDVIVWPLKALCDYVEATNDLGFLDEKVAWRREDNLERTERTDSVEAHVDKLLEMAKQRFIPGTHLISYGEGDWNDSLQPADPSLRDHMVSSWTVALLFQQLRRYAEVLRRAGRTEKAAELDALADAMAADLNRYLIRDGVLAGYAIFGDGEPELLLHPSDTRTGLKYSLLPMKRCILAGLFTPGQTERHLAIIREHLLFPDGVRLMDRPVTYRGGPEEIFRRAESAAFFGREIGLMYTHAHLRYGEAMALLGEADALWRAILVANPIAVTEKLANASLRQRNTYFSSSDAAFPDRYAASADWDEVKAGDIPVDGGWRIYSSGPGLYTNLILRHALGTRRYFGERIVEPVLPAALGEVTLETTIDGHRRKQRL